MVLKILIILLIAVVPFLLERGDNMEIKNSLFGYMYGRVADMKFRYFTTEYRKIHFFFWFPRPFIYLDLNFYQVCLAFAAVAH